jgi:hypothetical protein
MQSQHYSASTSGSNNAPTNSQLAIYRRLTKSNEYLADLDKASNLGELAILPNEILVKVFAHIIDQDDLKSYCTLMRLNHFFQEAMLNNYFQLSEEVLKNLSKKLVEGHQNKSAELENKRYQRRFYYIPTEQHGETSRRAICVLALGMMLFGAVLIGIGSYLTQASNKLLNDLSPAIIVSGCISFVIGAATILGITGSKLADRNDDRTPLPASFNAATFFQSTSVDRESKYEELENDSESEHDLESGSVSEHGAKEGFDRGGNNNEPREDTPLFRRNSTMS